MNVTLGFCSAFETIAVPALILPGKIAEKIAWGGKLAQPVRLTYIPAIGSQRHAD
ncbi:MULTISPECIES: hypothetical protein [unclassified Mesorhizobium]|uniref:hypothetical protein n=1 Tax=unclassified Mesorhizobium TaxID=325217 RepID=UPI00241776F9|nr:MULTISPECIES: hypothetical protein [unclassified Mesorhizobium]WFP65297.1 hypothetical protein QAZ47_12515 [Mesorhizobium sp. WSM4904]WFP78561.1 hypothetical protein QAZ22_12455 [Mesorhizobium sp. WSM4906]